MLSLAGMVMEKRYWLSRKRASFKSARDAVSAEARLIHYDLAGRYSLKAVSAETQAIDLAELCRRGSTPALATARHPAVLRCLRSRTSLACSPRSCSYARSLWVELLRGPLLQRLDGPRASNAAPAALAIKLLMAAFGVSALAAVLAIAGWISV